MQYAYCANDQWYWFWPAGWVIFIVVLIILSRHLGLRGHGYHYRHWSGNGIDALSVLKQRYAAGDITKEEYDRMKKDLES